MMMMMVVVTVLGAYTRRKLTLINSVVLLLLLHNGSQRSSAWQLVPQSMSRQRQRILTTNDRSMLMLSPHMDPATTTTITTFTRTANRQLSSLLCRIPSNACTSCRNRLMASRDANRVQRNMVLLARAAPRWINLGDHRDGVNGNPFLSRFNRIWSVLSQTTTRFIRSACFRRSMRLQRFLTSCALIMLLMVGSMWMALLPPAWAISGGRMGGNFGTPSAPPTTNMNRRSPSRFSSSSLYKSRPKSAVPRFYHSPAPSRFTFHSLGSSNSPSTTTITTTTTTVPKIYPSKRQSRDDAVASKFTTTDVIVLTGTGVLLVNGFRTNNNHHGNIRRHLDSSDDDDDDDEESFLGSGATFAAFTAAMSVRNRRDPDCILQRLRRLSEKADTSTRRGVQRLVSAVALEILRQESSIVSAHAHSMHYPTPKQAERVFQVQSIRNRSKFDRETVNTFGGENRPDDPKIISHTLNDSNGVLLGNIDDDAIDEEWPYRPTMAAVTITMAIQGDSTELPRIRDRGHVHEALSTIASDAQLGDCLLAAEILWSPEDERESLSRDEIYADYPDLIPL